MKNEGVEVGVGNESLKGVTNVAKALNEIVKPYEIGSESEQETVNYDGSEFRVSSNLPAKTNKWTKVKNLLFYEIKLELTPYQQKIEDEINEFLHQEVTFKKVKDFLFQEITFG